MKRFNLFIVLAAILVTGLVSCTSSQMATDENEQVGRQVGNRLYIDDPYRGTVVLERDPYTGRYYDVTSRYSYGYGYDNGYNSPYSSRMSSPYYRNYNRGYGRVYQTPQQPTEEQKRQYQQGRDEARKKVLGQ
jgi:hypothetical protein